MDDSRLSPSQYSNQFCPATAKPFAQTRLSKLADSNLFPEAVALLASLGKLKDFSANNAYHPPERLANDLLEKLDYLCTELHSDGWEFIASILDDFSALILLTSTQPDNQSLDRRICQLIQALYRAKSKDDMLTCMAKIRQLCEDDEEGQ